MESLVTQNVMHASLCHMPSVGTGGTGGVTPRQGGQVRGGRGEGGQVGKWGTGGWNNGWIGGQEGEKGGEQTGWGHVQVGVRTNLYLMSHSSLPVARPYQLHSVQPP